MAHLHRVFFRTVTSLAVAAAFSLPAQAGTAWDEALQGDLSGNGLLPTVLSMTAGANTVLGTTGDSGSGVDRDYFSFTVPAGARLDSITLLPNTAVSGGVSFIAIQPGTQLTVSPSGAGASALIALGHYDNSQIGTDLLAAINISGTPGLPSGAYAVWVQDTGGPASYGFSFNLSPVPEVSRAALMASGLLVVVPLLRRSRARRGGQR